MLTADALQQKIAALPQPVQDYLYSEKAGELNVRIIDRNGLSEDQEPALFGLLSELSVKELHFDLLIPEITKRLNLDESKARQLAADIAGFRLLPLDKWIGDVTGYLRSLGANPDSYPADRIQIAERTRDEAAEEIIQSAGESMLAMHLKGRMRGVIESMLAGVRTEAQAKELLMRSEKIGGLGLDEAAAKRLLSEAKEEQRAVVIKEEAAPPVAPSPPPPATEPPPPPKPPKDDALTVTKEDEQELARFKAAALPPSDVEKNVNEIYQASGLATDDEAMQKRAKTIIGNRLRDVRDQMETLEIMTQPKELGGLNLGQDAARSLLNAIQAKLQHTEQTQKAGIQQEKAQWVEQEKTRKVESEAEAKVGQKAELERLYQSIVAKSPKAVKNAPAPAAPAVPANLPVAGINPVPPEYRPAPPPPVPPPATLVRPMPAVNAPSKPAVPPSAPPALAPRPKMEDVKAAPKLTGPVEELRAITITDFRRLSKDPKEACLKIKDKVDLLADQSYSRRGEGIAAWGQSEVIRTYLELMREGLNGKPLPEAIKARETEKKPVLTAEEFQAVAELSRQLRY